MSKGLEKDKRHERGCYLSCLDITIQSGKWIYDIFQIHKVWYFVLLWFFFLPWSFFLLWFFFFYDFFFSYDFFFLLWSFFSLMIIFSVMIFFSPMIYFLFWYFFLSWSFYFLISFILWYFFSYDLFYSYHIFFLIWYIFLLWSFYSYDLFSLVIILSSFFHFPLFPLIMNHTEIRLVHNPKENCHCNLRSQLMTDGKVHTIWSNSWIQLKHNRYICRKEFCKDFYWHFSGLLTHKWSMRPYFARVSIGTGFEPVLNWFQSTALTARLQIFSCISTAIPRNVKNETFVCFLYIITSQHSERSLYMVKISRDWNLSRPSGFWKPYISANMKVMILKNNAEFSYIKIYQIFEAINQT